jgi:polyribonucleotide nucleotidyltransferase
MDFKVAGTEDFVTALQLDTKIDGIPAEVLASALDQAKEARKQILAVMTGAIPAPREDVGEHAPKIESFEIPVEKIGEVIGPKGKMINTIQAETGAEVSVDDDGMVGIVSVASSDRATVDEAVRQIMLIVDPPTAEVGATYPGKVVNITKFGAFVNILPGRDGLLHISKIGGSKRIDKVEDVLELGQEIQVVVEDVDPNGKISLTPAEGDSEESAQSNTEAEEVQEIESEEIVEAESDENFVDADADADADADDDDDENYNRSDDYEEDDDDVQEVKEASFEEAFAAELESVHGDLGPESNRNRGRKRKGR